MSFLKSLNRQMERNQVARMAMLDVFEKSEIKDIDEFSLALWASIKESTCRDFLLEIKSCDELPFEFFVKLLIKIGFSCDNAARLMLNLHRQGAIVLATADQESLLKLEQYIGFQAGKHGVSLETCVRSC